MNYYLMLEENGHKFYWTGKHLSSNIKNAREYKEHKTAESALHRILIPELKAKLKIDFREEGEE